MWGGQEVTRHGGQGGVCAVLQLQPGGRGVSGERVEGGCHGKGAPAARVHGSCLEGIWIYRRYKWGKKLEYLRN